MKLHGRGEKPNRQKSGCWMQALTGDRQHTNDTPTQKQGLWGDPISRYRQDDPLLCHLPGDEAGEGDER